MKLLSSLFTLLFLAIGVYTVNAQTIVSTTPANKNVVLEEMTGKTCQFCPDGHKRAADLKAANPGRVVIMNVHEGGYAAGTPNYRTGWGDNLGTLFSISGYPTGAVNRTDFGAGVMHSRGDWNTNAATIMGQSSPVNVGATADIDLGTNNIIVNVEAYYTAAGTGTSNRFHALLLQDNIPGPQTGAATWYPAMVLPNGDYNHMHMLRHNFSPYAGEVISSVSAMSLYTNSYNYNIPTDYNAIATNMADMHVIVFVSGAGTTDPIESGADATMTLTTPPGTFIADMSAASNATAPQNYCDVSYTPSVLITNTSTQPIDTFEVCYDVNGGTPVCQMITTTLAAGANTTISFPAITLPGGTVSVNYMYDFASYNSTLIDVTSNNNATVHGSFTLLNTLTAVGTSIATTFDGLALGTEAPANAIADNPDGIRAYSVDNTVSSAVTWNLGGFGNSNGCFRWDFYAIDAGLSSQIVYEKIDLSSMGVNDTFELSWNHGYAQYTSENDRLDVKVSTDCGVTWTNVWSKAGSLLSTVPPMSSGRFYPNVTEWVANVVDLSAYIGQAELMIAFEGVSAYGNSLYVDDINTDHRTGPLSIGAIDNPTTAFSIYPNPVRNNLTVEFELDNATDMTISIVNALGQTVQHVATQNFVGQNTLNVNTSALSSGVYFVNAISENGVVTQRFVVEK